MFKWSIPPFYKITVVFFVVTLALSGYYGSFWRYKGITDSTAVIHPTHSYYFPNNLQQYLQFKDSNCYGVFDENILAEMRHKVDVNPIVFGKLDPILFNGSNITFEQIITNSTLGFINIGSGTTGTIAIFEYICRNSFPYIHWVDQCFVSGNVTFLAGDWVSRWKKCLYIGGCSSTTLLMELAQAILQIAHVQPVGYPYYGISDTPVDFLYPYLLPIFANKFKIVMQSIRDPVAYVPRRMRHSKVISIPICIEKYWTQIKHPMDVVGCLRVGDSIDPKNLFVTSSDFKDSSSYYEYAARAYSMMTAYNALITPPEKLHIMCLWDQNQTEAVPLEIQDKLNSAIAFDESDYLGTKTWNYYNSSISEYADLISDILTSSKYFNDTTCELVKKFDKIDESLQIGKYKKFNLFSSADTLTLLNGSSIHVIGDSVARRLFLSLNYYILSRNFTDPKYQSITDISVKQGSSTVKIIFYWAPYISDKIQVLQKLKFTVDTDDFIFIGSHSHELVYAYGSSPKNFYDNIELFNKTITNMNCLGFRIVIDGILSLDTSHPGRHKSSHEIEAANMFYTSLYSKQNLFGYIDMWNWIKAEKRRNCVGRDITGVQFTNNDIRLLHLQAFLNYIYFFKNARSTVRVKEAERYVATL